MVISDENADGFEVHTLHAQKKNWEHTLARAVGQRLSLSALLTIAAQKARIHPNALSHSFARTCLPPEWLIHPSSSTHTLVRSLARSYAYALAGARKGESIVCALLGRVRKARKRLSTPAALVVLTMVGVFVWVVRAWWCYTAAKAERAR